MKVAVVDGHPTVCLGLKQLLGAAVGMRVVGVYETGEEALRLAEEAHLDLVILGLNLTGERDGIEVCRKLKALQNPPYVLIHIAYNTATIFSLVWRLARTATSTSAPDAGNSWTPSTALRPASKCCSSAAMSGIPEPTT